MSVKNILLDSIIEGTNVITPTGSTFIDIGAPVGTWSQGNLAGSATNSNFIRYTPNDGYTTSWYQWAGSFANGPDRRNQVMRFGWNVDGGGGRVTTGANNGVLASEYEQYFEGGHNQMERHETFVDTDGYQTRWLSFEGHLDDGSTALFQYASTMVLGSGRTSNDPGRLVIAPATTRVFSPNNFNNIYLADDQMYLVAGPDITATVTAIFDPAGDLTLRTKRGFLQDGYAELLMQWQALGGPGSGAIWMRSPDDSAEVFVNNGGLQLIAGGILGIRHTGSVLNLNNGTAGITMQRSGTRSFQFGDASNSTKIYGPDDNAYLSLNSGGTGAQLADINEKITAATGAGIIFTTNNIERARFDYSAFRPSTNGTYKNGDNGERWSETWTVDLYASGTSNVGNVIPITNDAYSIGSSSNNWHDGYFAGTLSMGDGTPALPSYTFSSGTGNGMFHYPARGSNSISWSTGGAEQMALSGTNLISPQRIVTIDGADLFLDNNVKVSGSLYPNTNATQSFGNATHYWSDGYFAGTITSGNLIPLTSDGYSIGSGSSKWHDGYFAGTLVAENGANIGSGPGFTVNSAGTVTSTLNANGGVQTNTIQRWSGGDANLYTTGASFTTHIGGAGNTVSLESNTVVFAPTTAPNTVTIDGYTINPTTNAVTLGDASHYWKDGYITNTHSSWFDTKMGTQLTAASTVTPTSGLHHVTGATTIDTIATTNVPSSSTVELTLIADGGAITLGTTNIKVGGTIAQDTAQKLVWDGSFWYLVA